MHVNTQPHSYILNEMWIQKTTPTTTTTTDTAIVLQKTTGKTLDFRITEEQQDCGKMIVYFRFCFLLLASLSRLSLPTCWILLCLCPVLAPFALYAICILSFSTGFWCWCLSEIENSSFSLLIFFSTATIKITESKMHSNKRQLC